MSITVIIVNWNGGDLLRRCLSHLQMQSYPPRRILLMDNGSSDGSAQLAAQAPGVTVRYLNDNLGFAAANNRALDECDTEWVALLNPDALPDKDWLLNLMKATEQHPAISVFGSKQMQLETPDKIDGKGDIYHISGLLWRDGYGKTQSGSGDVGQAIFSPCACAAFYRLSVLKQVGGFDEDFFCYVEDVDLGFRLQLNNYPARYVPEATVYHAGSASTGGQRSDFSIYHGHRNMVWAFVKNMPGILFWLLLPLHAALNIVSVLYFSRQGQANIIVKAKKDALNGLPNMWRKRRIVQAQRTASILKIWRLLDKSLLLSRSRR
ncbi:MAG: glycosyltransferase family 2 protein [Methylobacter sp.]